ncbi:flagellar hook-basal body complex protein FliE [Microbulbifer sp. SAOS-129_SWC]|uniref:flagellar hook-basal body complex protein FliE n=1 Tax=Microbulbifer sp. SAOS-129_SWC TaxID=3145235 RepID=UPI00321739C8
MSIEPINPIKLDSLIPGNVDHQASASFSSWIAAQMGDLDQQINKSEAALQDLALGKAENLHDVMLELEKSKTEFQLALQVRNKVLEGYQEIMRMQV